MDVSNRLHRGPTSAPATAAASPNANGGTSKTDIALVVGGLGIVVISLAVISLYAAGKILVSYKLPTVICGSIGVVGGLAITGLRVSRIYRSGKENKPAPTVSSKPQPNATIMKSTRIDMAYDGHYQNLFRAIRDRAGPKAKSEYESLKIAASISNESFEVDKLIFVDNATPDAGQATVNYSLLHLGSYMRMGDLMMALMEDGAIRTLKNSVGETPVDLYNAEDGESSLRDFLPISFKICGVERGPKAKFSPFLFRDTYKRHEKQNWHA